MSVVLNLILHLLLFLVMGLAVEILPKQSCVPSPHLSIDLVLGRPHGPAEQGGAGARAALL